MNNSSIERAARAFAICASGVDDWDSLDPATQNRIKDAVVSALNTLRQPSSAVIRAGVRACRRPHRSEASQVAATWQSMLGAIQLSDTA